MKYLEFYESPDVREVCIHLESGFVLSVETGDVTAGEDLDSEEIW